jgi:hypothetical protein
MLFCLVFIMALPLPQVLAQQPVLAYCAVEAEPPVHKKRLKKTKARAEQVRQNKAKELSPQRKPQGEGFILLFLVVLTSIALLVFLLGLILFTVGYATLVVGLWGTGIGLEIGAFAFSILSSLYYFFELRSRGSKEASTAILGMSSMLMLAAKGLALLILGLVMSVVAVWAWGLGLLALGGLIFLYLWLTIE